MLPENYWNGPGSLALSLLVHPETIGLSKKDCLEAISRDMGDVDEKTALKEYERMCEEVEGARFTRKISIIPREEALHEQLFLKKPNLVKVRITRIKKERCEVMIKGTEIKRVREAIKEAIKKLEENGIFEPCTFYIDTVVDKASIAIEGIEDAKFFSNKGKIKTRTAIGDFISKIRNT